jgi:hypothetical protein
MWGYTEERNGLGKVPNRVADGLWAVAITGLAKKEAIKASSI